MSAVYQPMSISKNLRLWPSTLALAIHIIFKPHHITHFFFHTELAIGIWRNI